MNEKKYKEAVDDIKVSEELKNETFHKMINQKRKNNVVKMLAMCAVFLLVVSVSYIEFDKNKDKNIIVNDDNKQVAKEEIDLPRFNSMEELKDYLSNVENTRNYYETKSDIAIEESITDSSTVTGAQTEQSTNNETNDYSETNTQVEGVDEADIIKTDGNYIYYVAKNKNKIVIIDSENIKVLDEIDDYETEAESLSPQEIYIKDNKLIVIASKWKKTNNEDSYRYYPMNSVCALIYDITNKEDVKLLRNVEIGGRYISSRMIENNLYFVSQKSVYYYEECKDEEIMPLYKDTVVSEEEKCVSLDRIYYFPETESSSYINVVGVNIEKEEEANIETFLGAGSEIYASKEFIYLTKTNYMYGLLRDSDSNTTSTEIYKFKLDNSEISFKAKTKINGNINNQFSMDEYNNNLRIATTSYDENGNSTNNLYILDENLNQLGSIENMAEEEKIYSVRFMGDTGYIVTFKQVDPLFVIDLSNPEKPEIKGELKIPGYSSYLHPYDDTHIIGIGQNTEETKYGATVSTNMKMSMFDITDLKNPTELFSVSIGGKGTYSEILNNHKALFFHKEKDLIGFPITIYEEGNSYSYKTRMQGAIIYEIDMENKEFKEKGTIQSDGNNTNQYYTYDYNKVINRMIYINENIYALSDTEMKVVDINTLEEKGKLEYE